MTRNRFSLLMVCLIAVVLNFPVASHAAPYSEWQRSGSLFILTTPEGAALPAEVTLEGFPLLVRLHRDSFDFAAAQPHGEDLRFATSAGEPLAYQIEEWNADRGEAVVWVRIPKIHGNARQELRVYWGNPAARSESSGPAVFSASNGYASVWHLGEEIQDEVGTLTSQNVGTTPVAGMIGTARQLAGKQGIFGGDKIANYPTGGSEHSTSAWFRAERVNCTIIGWGNEGGGRGSKVRMQFRSPPHLHIDSDFSDVDAPERFPLGDWGHVTHTYANSRGRIYLNGKLAGEAKPTLNINSPARLWLGGWYHNYDFVGTLDEVRVSRIARSAEWVQLEYENQRPMQTLVGPIVRPGNDFSVSTTQLTVEEGTSVALTAQAGGAQKVTWIEKRDGKEHVVAVDRFQHTFQAGRVSGDATATIQVRAVYPTEVKTAEIAISIREAIPDPRFALKIPPEWDGRSTIEVVPQITNRASLPSSGTNDLRFNWQLTGPAVIKEILPGKLILKRAMGSGKLSIQLAITNGGAPSTQSAAIAITEPATDPWIARIPGEAEQPTDGQFYARDNSGFGTLIYSGTLATPAESVLLRVFAGERLIAQERQTPGPGNRYTLTVRLKAGLVKYRTEFGTGEQVTHTATDLVCGDAFLLIGQSNTVATDFGKEKPLVPNEWVRTFGTTNGSPQGARIKLWAPAEARSPGGKSEIGYWGMELGRRLVESQQVPICILNGAVGGTRIDQHQRNSVNPTDVNTIYGRLLWRVREAGLTHGIRGIIWHQGENDQGADGPTGGYGWETYRPLFHELAGAWKQDYPNLQQIHLFQIWPKSCGMGINGSDNRLREVQRTLPRDFSRMNIMSTLGVRPPGGCHFPAAGYAEFARLITPLIERDHYGKRFDENITPPNLRLARYLNPQRDSMELEFDQPIEWSDKLVNQFWLDGVNGQVASGTVRENRLTLKLAAPGSATNITYLDSKAWQQENLLWGKNGIAALTFCEVPILAE